MTQNRQMLLNSFTLTSEQKKDIFSATSITIKDNIVKLGQPNGKETLYMVEKDKLSFMAEITLISDVPPPITEIRGYGPFFSYRSRSLFPADLDDDEFGLGYSRGSSSSAM